MNRFASHNPDFDGEQYDAMVENESALDGASGPSDLSLPIDNKGGGHGSGASSSEIDVDAIERDKANRGERLDDDQDGDEIPGQ